MTEPLLIFLGGLLGSSHCVGMCGGFALALGATGHGVGRHLAYGLGRVFTYTAGGAAAGYGGTRLAATLPEVVHAQAWLCLAAGALLVIQGWHAAGFGLPWRATNRPPCLAVGLLGDLLRATRSRSPFLGGMVNGLLPCGLVYAYLALAAAGGGLLGGAATMLLFGLGTIPLLVLVGLGGAALSGALRRRVLTVAAWCVVVTGALTVGRGVAFLAAGPAPETACPCCAHAE
jgi:sulfite exporter TauE/SafE